MRRHLIRRLQQSFAVVSFVIMAWVLLLIAQSVGVLPADLGNYLSQTLFPPTPPQVALISGHAGNDSGAVCTDANGQTLLTEASVNAQVTDLVYARLQQARIDTIILDEYDARLDGLVAGVVLSLHADSCIDLSGYKAASRPSSAIPKRELMLLACLQQHYEAHTGLSPHLNTITHDMTAYHAFRKVAAETPIAILELGFLGGDQRLLTEGVEEVAEGVAESLQCFLREETNNKE